MGRAYGPTARSLRNARNAKNVRTVRAKREESTSAKGAASCARRTPALRFDDSYKSGVVLERIGATASATLEYA
jgi:hypothetical protein